MKSDKERLMAYRQRAQHLTKQMEGKTQKDPELEKIYEHFQSDHSEMFNNEDLEEAREAYHRLMEVQQQLKESYEKVLLTNVKKT